MEIDHLVVFSANQGQEANELLDLGFVEGSSRVHVGQGTANRKFYFDNVFLELLWVVDQQAVNSPLVVPTKLGERASWRSQQGSPFGLCLVNTPDTDPLFSTSMPYQPPYLPAGLAIEVLTNEHCPNLPWTFRLPFKGPQKKADEPTQPTHHRKGIRWLTTTEFIVPVSACSPPYISHFQHERHILFGAGDACQLVLTFDHHRNKKSYQLASLPIVIQY